MRRRRPAETPLVAGNRVAILVDGGPFFDAAIEVIGRARHYVLVETYILRADASGRRVAYALKERARAGVEVALSYDGYGSLGLDEEFVWDLERAGVKLLEFAPISLLRGSLSWYRRNHRKMVVADGEVGIIGGMNIADEYADPNAGGEGWRDTAAQIEGPSVAQLEAMFRNTWHRAEGPPLSSEPRAAPTFPEGHLVRIVGNHARRDRAEIRRAYLRAIFAARRSIRVMNAYFSPDPVILRALFRAARRGVKVQIITAGATDVWPVRAVSRRLYGSLLRAGVEIFEWHERVLHAKTAVIDGLWSTIGSANFTHRAFLIDLEVNATVVSPLIGAKMDAIFDEDLAHCRVIDKGAWRARPWTQRVLEWFFSLFRRLI